MRNLNLFLENSLKKCFELFTNIFRFLNDVLNHMACKNYTTVTAITGYKLFTYNYDILKLFLNMYQCKYKLKTNN